MKSSSWASLKALVLFSYLSKHATGHVIGFSEYLQTLLTTYVWTALDAFKILSNANERLFSPTAKLGF